MNCDYFYEIEKKYNLFEKEYNGFEFWTYARQRVAWRIRKQADNLNEGHHSKKLGLYDKSKLFLKQMKYILSHGKIPKREHDVLFIAHPRRVYNGEKYECIYTDSLAEKFDKALTVEKPYQEIHYEPAQTKKILYTDIVDIKVKVFSVYKSLVCGKEINTIKSYFEKHIAEAIAELNAYYGTIVSISDILSELVYMYYTYIVMKKYFTKLLKNTKPRTVVEVVSYSMECQIINEIAYEMGIPTVELQHGAIIRDHIPYNYPATIKIRQFPQNIFLFSDFWKEGIYYPIAQECIFSAGYPYLEKQAQKYKNYKETLEKKTRILFLSSGPIGNMLVDVAIMLYRNFPASEYEITYKLHPGEYSEWEKRYSKLAESGIKVISNNRVDLYQLFAESDIQVSGYNSTTIIEGLYFDLSTYVLDYCMSDEFRKLEKTKHLKTFKTPEELLDMIIKQEKEQKQKEMPLWEKDALENILYHLNGIMKKV